MAAEGIVFVYSRFLWAGLVPFAIALEHAGFSRFGHRNMLATSQDGMRRHHGSYIMLTSDSRLCGKANFAKDLATAVAPSNAEGRAVKVILACGVATEGIDFKCVRSVHLMDPWYHNNKKAQIIGRAARKCSHADLPVSLRNVTVYLHASLPPTGITNPRETVDLHAYRISEFKQTKIRKVERLLRAVSIDCELNRHSLQDEALANVKINVLTARGNVLKNYNVAKNLSASYGTCIVDKSSLNLPGSDASTHDPWFHAPDLISRHLAAIEQVLAVSGGESVTIATLADIETATSAKLGSHFDKTMFSYGLQKGIEDAVIKYRGGTYVLAQKKKIGNCVRKVTLLTKKHTKKHTKKL